MTNGESIFSFSEVRYVSARQVGTPKVLQQLQATPLELKVSEMARVDKPTIHKNGNPE